VEGLPVEPTLSNRLATPSLSLVVWPRLLIGWIVLICAEVFSGASLKIGLWNPWTLLVTYWLYFGHFFFLTTLAVRTGRTSFWALYLWGVLYGLYESWITKVIWSGYDANGKFALGQIGPYGFSELSMVFLFHPIMSFILPLAVACVICPPLRRLFPDLAWFNGRTKGARICQTYLVFGLAPIVGMNSGGPLNLGLNLAFVAVLLLILKRLARRGLAAENPRPIVGAGNRGLAALGVYLAVLYGLTYAFLRPEQRPPVGVQLFTFVFYALALVGLGLLPPRNPAPASGSGVEPRERKLVVSVCALILGSGFVLSFVGAVGVLFPLVIVSFVLWTPLGFLLFALALAKSVKEGLTDPAVLPGSN